MDTRTDSPELTRVVSDRSQRFSGIASATPYDRRSNGLGSRDDSYAGSCGTTYDSNDYWDGYRDGHRDGFRRGYRHGYWDGRWDDCWSPRHRWGWGLGWGRSCWSGWSFSFNWYSPVIYSYPVYYSTPVYCPPVTYTTTTWYGSSTVTTTTTYYDPSPRLELVDFCDAVATSSTTIVYAPSERVVEVNLPAYQPTVYRSDELAGVLGWNDTPDAVIGSVMSVSPSDRATASANFLGRVPAGGWDVGFEADKVVDGERQLWFRSLTPGPRGQRVLIVMVPRTSVPTLYAGQRVQITGRLAEICVDDPYEQAGRVTLDDGSVKY